MLILESSEGIAAQGEVQNLTNFFATILILGQESVVSVFRAKYTTNEQL